MQYLKPLFAMIALIFAGTSSYADSNNQLTYFGTNQYQLTQESVATEYNLLLTNYNLDAQRNLEAMISSGLPEDRDEAQRIATKRMESIDEAVTTKILYGTALLFKWDIKKLPAFVFGDGNYVIYGVADTKTAIDMFLKSRKPTEY